MGMARKQQTFHVNETLPFPPHPMANTIVSRNLGKYQLGGVIFGCKNSTIKECFSKQLFGLPAHHFSYVKDIDRGLPLFLFNYSDRKLHGIFEAAGKGQMYIDPYAWTTYCTETTKYPAQVKMRVRLQCQTLPEDKFAQVIIGNYFSRNHFWFELDHIQTNRLISLLVSVAFAPGSYVPQYQMTRRNVSEFLPSHATLKRDEAFRMSESEGKNFTQLRRRKDSDVMTFLDRDIQPMKTITIVKEENQDEKTLIYEKLKELALSRESKDHSLPDIANGSPDQNNMCSMEKVDSSGTPFQDQYTKLIQEVQELIQEVQELMAFKKIQTQKNCFLEHKLMDATFEIQHLKDRCTMLESKYNLPLALVKKIVTQSSSELQLDPKESLFLIGGSDGESELASMDLYCPSKSVIKSRKLTSATYSYNSAVHLNDELYGYGGVKGESYNSIREKWTLYSSLSPKTESLAGVSLNNKIFVAGGGTRTVCFSGVEILDFYVEHWISTRSMIEKFLRFALAAMKFKGALYASGVYNGNHYIESAEIFDHKEHSWTIISNMNTKRGCYPMIVLNEKIGGFNRSTMVSIIDEELDSRLKAWVMEEQINNHPRVYFAAANVKKGIYLSDWEIQRVRTLSTHSSKSTMVVYDNN